MSSSEVPKLKKYSIELSECKKFLFESELERKVLSKDYTDLVKKFNAVDKENVSLRHENMKLRRLLYGERKDNNQVIEKQ